MEAKQQWVMERHMRHINQYKLTIKITKLILIFWHNRFRESIVKSIVEGDVKIVPDVHVLLFNDISI